MFTRILVATDLQASTRRSLRAACDLLHDGGQVLLVHVVRPIARPPDDQNGTCRRSTDRAAAEMLARATGFQRERHLDIQCIATVGSPAQEIARIAAERKVDLVVLAHDAVDDPATLGSVSYQVAHLAPCAVLVLKASGRLAAEPRRVEVSLRRQPAPTQRPRAAETQAHVR